MTLPAPDCAAEADAIVRAFDEATAMDAPIATLRAIAEECGRRAAEVRAIDACNAAAEECGRCAECQGTGRRKSRTRQTINPHVVMEVEGPCLSCWGTGRTRRASDERERE